MAAQSDRSQRTEQPTAKRLQDALLDGNVPRTKEVSAAFVLGAFFLFCQVYGAEWLNQMRAALVGTLGNLRTDDMNVEQWLALVRSLGGVATPMVLLPVAVLGAASIAGNLVQGKAPLTLKPLKPDLTRISPAKGLKKVFSWQSTIQLLKTLAKMVMFSAVAVHAVWGAFEHGLPGGAGAEGALAAIVTLGAKVILRVALLWLALALLDLLWTRFDWKRNLKMTKQEIKEERRQAEGDPHVRQKIRTKQLEAARSRMMADVPRATVVVTNPTHVAVALRYVRGESDVPQVLAKGKNLIAQRIKELAREHGIPIVEDPPLARALERAVPVGGFIPSNLFRAVAEVLAMVLHGRRRAGHRPAHNPAHNPIDEAHP